MNKIELVKGVRLVMDELSLTSDEVGASFDAVVWSYGVKAYRRLALSAPLRFAVSVSATPALVREEDLPCGWKSVWLRKPRDYLKLLSVKLKGWLYSVHRVGDVGEMDTARLYSVVKGAGGGPHKPEVWVDDDVLYCYAVKDSAGAVVESFRYIPMADETAEELRVQKGMESALIDMTASLVLEGFGEERSQLLSARALLGLED